MLTVAPPPPAAFAVPLDVFAALAAIAAAIAIAYGSLPNFRHRTNLVAYVRNKIESHGILKLLVTNPGLKNYESWGVLYRLGNLRESEKYLVPGVQLGDGRVATDQNFAKRKDVRRYNWLFISNLDKSLGIALGALAVSVIWFGVLDRLSFATMTDGDPARQFFLCGVAAFHLLTLAFCVVTALLHIMFCSANPKPEGWRKYILRGWNVLAVLTFVALVLWSVPGHFAFDHTFNRALGVVVAITQRDPEQIIYSFIKIVLLGTILLPLLMLWYGNRLSEKMEKEADNAIGILKAGAAEAVGRATLRQAIP